MTYYALDAFKLPLTVLPGEDSEVVNEGMYGKALCEYLERELPLLGLTVNFFCVEDWGWWIDVTECDLTLGLMVHSHNVVGSNPEIYVISSSITSCKKWYWNRFKTLDVSKEVNSVFDKLEIAFESDDDIWSVERTNEFPL